MNNIINLLGGINQFNSNFERFKRNLNGDPKRQVEELINTGKMTQEQFNKYSQMASILKGYIK